MRIANSLLLALAAFCLCASIAAAEAPAYLFLIDQAPGMQPRREATLRTVSDLIRTGFHERIQPGETFAIWSCAQTLRTNPPSHFDTNNATQIAELATAQIPKTTGPSNLKAALDVVQPVDNLTVFILTDGRQSISSTPFDVDINRAMTQNRDRFAHELKPFLITLLARDGRWVASSVHTNLGAAIVLPNPPAPDLLERALQIVRATGLKTNAPASPKQAPALKPVETAKTKPAEPPVVTKAAEPKPKTEPLRPNTTEPRPLVTPPLEIASTKPAEKPAIKPPAQNIQNPPTPPPTTPITVTPSVVPKQDAPEKNEAKITPAIIPTNTATVVAAAPPASEEKVATPATAPSTQEAAIIPVPVAETKPGPSFPWRYLLPFFALVGGAGWLIYYKLKPRPMPPGSMISQALPEPTPPPSKVIPKT